MANNPVELIREYQGQDFDYWLNKVIDRIEQTALDGGYEVDTRQGSILYDAVAPVSMELAEHSTDIAESVRQMYTQTATGEFLDWKAVEKGTSRELATYTRATARFVDDNQNPISNVNVGDRFSSISEQGDQPITYAVVRVNSDLTALLQAEETGTRPNSYTGQILPITPNDVLNWAEITEVSLPARNAEDDETLRARLLNQDDYIAYGGNVADYYKMIKTIDDVGALQVYPAWRGGGTVKLVILDNNYKPASQLLVNNVKETIDPVEFTSLGYGLAPIGHSVTVTVPSIRKIDIQTTVTTDGTVSANDLKANIVSGIQGYFDRQRKLWGNIASNKAERYNSSIFRAQILSEVLKVEHVTNATLPVLNGENKDVALVFNNDTSEVAQLGEVVIDD